VVKAQEGELASVVAVDDRARGGPAGVEGHAEGVRGEVGSLGAVDGPADDTAAQHVYDDAAVDLALAGGMLGDVGDLEPVRAVGGELALDQGGDRFLGPDALGPAAQRQPGDPDPTHEQRDGSPDEGTAGKIAECDRKLAQYLDAAANPVTVAGWISEAEAEKASYALVTRRHEPRRRMTLQQIKDTVDKFVGIARVLIEADPDDKAEIFRQLGLRLTYHPG
jgi:hypothetical protein